MTVNTNYGRVNGFLVYLYDGPRVPEFDRPGVANVDKIKGRVSVFLGIPYAQPPIGEARLMVSALHKDCSIHIEKPACKASTMDSLDNQFNISIP